MLGVRSREKRMQVLHNKLESCDYIPESSTTAELSKVRPALTRKMKVLEEELTGKCKFWSRNYPEDFL